MSRIGKKQIQIPQDVVVSLSEGRIFIKGPRGEISKSIPSQIDISLKDGVIALSPKVKNASALWGTERSLISNMIEGVSKGFEIKLEVQGIGYKIQKENNGLSTDLGFSNPIEFQAPEGIELSIEQGKIIKVSGADKELVGKVASRIKAIKKPDPYKGKGIRYMGEQIKLKLGKKAVGVGA